MRKTMKRNKGVTLVEVLVATLLLAILSAPILSALVSSTKVQARARTRQETTSLTQDIMEELKADTLASIYTSLEEVSDGTAESYSLGGVSLTAANISSISMEKSTDMRFTDRYDIALVDVNNKYDITITAVRDDDGYGEGISAFGDNSLPQNFKYNLTVDLCEKGSTEVFSEFTGTKLETLLITYPTDTPTPEA